MADHTIRFDELTNNTNRSWWKDRGMRVGFFHIFVLYSAVYALGYDGALLNGLQALPQWQTDFDKPAGTRLGLIAASYYLPKIPLVFVIAWMVDRYGRKSALYMGSVFMFAGAIVGGFSYSQGQLMASRALLGVGTAAAQVAASSLVPELAHPRIRHWAGSFLNVTYFVSTLRHELMEIGSILAAWFTFAMVYYPGTSWQWRIPTLLQGLGPILLGAGTWFVPQSPRWLVAKGRVSEAHIILATYHANGSMNDELVLFELAEIQEAVRIEAESGSGTWKAWFQTRSNRQRLLVILIIGTATQWAGNGIINYFLIPVLKTVGITSSVQQAGINGGLSIWSWFSAILGASLVERAGRRTLFLVSIAGMFFCFIFMLGFSGGYASTGNQSIGLGMIPFIFLFQFFYAIALTPIPLLYVPEITPLSMRAKAAALLPFSQNCAQAFNQFANPVALAAIGWKYYSVYAALLAIYFVLFWVFVRETKGLTTEEAALVYEDVDNVDQSAVPVQVLRSDAMISKDQLSDIKVEEEHKV